MEKFIKGTLKEVVGDAVYPQTSNLCYILQIVNDEGKYGAGFSGAIAKRFPKVQTEYRALWREKYGQLTLGDIQYIQVSADIIVVNMIAQKGTVSENNPKPIKLDAVKSCLNKIAKEIILNRTSCSIHCPKIGCGLAGGTWEEIKPLIESELINKGINVTVYELPEN